MSADDLRSLYKQLDESDKYKKENKLLYIKPLPPAPPWPEYRLNKPQTDFMDCYTDDGLIPKRIIAKGANKVCKSWIGAIRGVCLALGEHPFLPDSHPLRYTNKQIPTPNVGLVAGEHLTQVVEKKLVPAYLEWIPKITGFSPRKHVKRNSQGVIVKIEIPNDLNGNPLGSVIYFGHYLDHEAQEGIDFNWVHFDEPPTQKFYTAVARGLVAYDGVMWMAFTSLKEPWIYDMIAERSVDYGGDDKTTRVVEFGDIWQNHVSKGGFLSTQAIEEFIADVPKEEQPARIHGEWMRGGERIFGSFIDGEPYVCPDYEIPKHWTWYEGIDPHDGKDTIWIFLAVAPNEINILGERVNRVFLVDYLRLSSGMSISEMAKEIKIKRAELGYTEPNSITMDGKHGKRRQASVSYRDSVSWQEKMEDVDIGYIELADQKPGDVDVGHKIVREYLKPQYSKLFEKEVPGLVVMERNRGKGGPIEAMLKYRRKKDSDKPEDDEYKDPMDALRYPLMKMPTYVERYVMEDRASGRVVNEYTGR